MLPTREELEAAQPTFTSMNETDAALVVAFKDYVVARRAHMEQQTPETHDMALRTKIVLAGLIQDHEHEVADGTDERN